MSFHLPVSIEAEYWVPPRVKLVRYLKFWPLSRPEMWPLLASTWPLRLRWRAETWRTAMRKEQYRVKGRVMERSAGANHRKPLPSEVNKLTSRHCCGIRFFSHAPTPPATLTSLFIPSCRCSHPLFTWLFKRYPHSQLIKTQQPHWCLY